MLLNGLGEALGQSIEECNRVFDLFTGSGAVAWHVAQNYSREVIASDLQTYAVVLAAGVIERTQSLKEGDWVDAWLQQAEALRPRNIAKQARLLQNDLGAKDISELATKGKEICDSVDLPICAAYGGHYYSPLQALWFDTLRQSLPAAKDERKVGLAALVIAASKAAAAPGHTAQPFKPNATAGRFLAEAWARDVPSLVRQAVSELSKKHSRLAGMAILADANDLAKSVKEGDLVFLDPPYSGVHYSRFYHVLESIAVGQTGEISGVGRYPPALERPRSDYSLRTKSKLAFDHLLKTLSDRGASAIVTFPAGAASNGLTGEDVTRMAESHFAIQEAKVSSRFSTLGGDKKHREARQATTELILRLSPR